MSYRTIVVELQADRSPAARLTAAHAVARRVEANLIGLHVAAPPVMPMIWEGGGAVYIGPELLDAQHKAIEETRERMKALVDGIAPADATVTLRATEGDPALLVAQAAHAADLVITTRDQDSTSESAGLAQALVIAAGVPVLMLPPTYVDDGGRLGRLARGDTRGSRGPAVPARSAKHRAVRRWRAGS